jgi:hypothetical protein
MFGLKKHNLTIGDIETLFTWARDAKLAFEASRFAVNALSKWKARAISCNLSYTQEYRNYLFSFILVTCILPTAGFFVPISYLMPLNSSLWNLLYAIPLGIAAMIYFFVFLFRVPQILSGFTVFRSSGRGGTNAKPMFLGKSGFC